MPLILALCVGLVVATTVTHYEVLRLLSFGLPGLRIPARAKLIIVILAAFGSHSLQMLMYGAVYYVLIHGLLLGSLLGGNSSSLETCMYFSAQTFTSLGFGDLLPAGPVRMVAGAEALNGLLLIGWSASYTYLSMERFWNGPGASGS